MKLTPRLQKIASLVPKNSVMADIGTDHAYIPAYCILNGICQKAFAMDVNSGPLSNAEETLTRYGISDKVELRLSNGLERLSPDEADTVVIAGMGGLLIKSILENGNLKEGTTLILQPMLAVKELRQYLYESEMAVDNEYLAKEDRKLYNIIVATVGKKSEYTREDIVIGRNIRENCPELAGQYKENNIARLNKIINGLKNAQSPDIRAIEESERELEVFETL